MYRLEAFIFKADLIFPYIWSVLILEAFIFRDCFTKSLLISAYDYSLFFWLQFLQNQGFLVSITNDNDIQVCINLYWSRIVG